MSATAVLTAHVSRESQVQSEILRHFDYNAQDGWFYPRGGRPLARVSVHVGTVRVQRRRRAQGAWMPILTASVDQFDAEAFAMWRAHWPLVA